MKYLFAVVAIASWLGAAEARAQVQILERVTLGAGEAVTLQFDDAGGALLIDRGEAWPLTPFEQSVVRDMTGGVFDYAVGSVTAPITGAKRPDADALAPNIVRMRLVYIPGQDHSLLLIENGYGAAFRYRAAMVIDGASEATDVCLVQPNLRGFEHWPYRVDRIELANLRLQPWRSGDAVPCE